ncbi:MAG: prolipoprotein diacylglyceryl transferase [Phycisphaerae bacterium]|nr:prolipoprotein diacylglyceryl transferase [Phycisphaerae bacterium]
MQGVLMTLAAWLHTLDPFALRITEDFGIRWYGLSYVAGFMIAYVVLKWLAKHQLTVIPRDRVGDAIVVFVLGILIGGRLGYVLVYEPSLAWTLMDTPPWWGVLAINRGGMASHGGMAGLILAAWRVSRGWKQADGTVAGRCSVLHVMDVLALVAPFGVFLGRIANFVNGELLGRVVTTPGAPGPWWAVQFPQELHGWLGPGRRGGHAPALTADQEGQLWALASKVALPGDSFARALDRLTARAAEFAAEIKPLLSSRHPSQLYQAAAEGVVIGVFLWLAAAKSRHAGYISALFFIGYGLLRVLTEIWRLPDPQFGEAGRPWGLSRGQWLSVWMVLGGALLLGLSKRSPGRWPGWRRGVGPTAPG